MLTLTESVEVANPEPGTDRRGRGVQWHVATARLEDRFTGAVLQHTTAPLTNAEHAQEMAALEVVHLLMDRVYRPILTPLLESVGATMEVGCEGGLGCLLELTPVFQNVSHPRLWHLLYLSYPLLLSFNPRRPPMRAARLRIPSRPTPRPCS